MEQYLQLMNLVISKGVDRQDRTEVGTRSIFGHQMRFDLKKGFPLVTTKRCHLRSIIHELLWFIRGETNIKSLNKHGVTIWDNWADQNGDLGPVYGRQWRAWRGPEGETDQLLPLITSLRIDPYSRRHLVVSWNVGELSKMALPPCHTLFQFYVAEGNLSCQLYQRSCDVFLGLPFNIASYALLIHMVAQQTGLSVGEFIWTGGDIHIYHTHYDQVRLQLQRTPRPLPTLRLNKAQAIDAYDETDFLFEAYTPYPGIRAPIAV